MVSRVYKIANKSLGAKGNIIKIRFRVGDEVYETYVPNDQYWISIKGNLEFDKALGRRG